MKLKNVMELHQKYLAEGEAEPDERAECSDVEQRHDPGLFMPADLPNRTLRVAVDAQVVHLHDRTDRRQNDQGDVDGDHCPRVLGAESRQYQQADELNGRHTEIAAARVDSQCPALESGRVERVDVGHR